MFSSRAAILSRGTMQSRDALVRQAKDVLHELGLVASGMPASSVSSTSRAIPRRNGPCRSPGAAESHTAQDRPARAVHDQISGRQSAEDTQRPAVQPERGSIRGLKGQRLGINSPKTTCRNVMNSKANVRGDGVRWPGNSIGAGILANNGSNPHSDGLRHHSETDTGKRDAELGGRDRAIDVLGGLGDRTLRLAALFASPSPQWRLAHRDEGKLSRHKEAIEDDQHGDA